MTDIEIARAHTLKPILAVAKKAGIPETACELYGNFKAKINLKKLNAADNLTGGRSGGSPSGAPIASASSNVSPHKGKLILVTAINPTSAGEGKTTCSIALADGLNELGYNAMLALREPSLGPVFGIKGGATGGGYAQVAPMDDINLHFTGDLHAITSANNLLASVIDNHIFQGNLLNFNPKKIVWKRCLDLNDRALRHIICGAGNAADGVMREDGFNITAASEIMAILCLCDGIDDLKRRIGRIVCGYDYDNKPITASRLKAENAMTILLKDAIKPNLVQTLAGTPALVHGGPFANIAHGCNSLIATKTCLSLADFTVTEAGFGADLGAEKFLDVKCRVGGIFPDCAVIVATVKALKLHGGVEKNNLSIEDAEAVKRGMDNLSKHVESITEIFGLKCIVAINKFNSDTEGEIKIIVDRCKTLGVEAIECEGWLKGARGALRLAKAVAAATAVVCDASVATTGKKATAGAAASATVKVPRGGAGHGFCYELAMPVEEKISAIAKKIYGAEGIRLTATAKKAIEAIEQNGFSNLPVIVAKTQYSLSDDPQKLNRPQNFVITVRDVELRAGAGFLVAVAGDIMLMPGLPKAPASDKMQIDAAGNITNFY